MRGHRFDNIEEIKEKTREELSAICKDDYKKKISKSRSIHRWDKNISGNGDHFEEDKVVL